MLTDMQVRSARPATRSLKLPDARGLYLLVTPTGHKSWRYRYQKDGRERIVTLGSYPAMSLAKAREAADKARMDARLEAPPPPPAAPSLAAVARDWHRVNLPRWKPSHALTVLTELEQAVFPALGSKPIGDVSAPDLLNVLRAIEERGATETAHRIRARMASIFAFGIASGACETNPAESIKKAMRPVVRNGHRPARTDLERAREALRQAESIPAHPATRLALRFLALTAVRPGEAREAQWSEMAGGKEPVWRIPAARMKSKRERAADVPDHVVPLSRQAMEVLAAMQPLSGRLPYVFPSTIASHKPLGENALSVLLRRAGLTGEQVPHGWRATFSSIMNERYPADRAVIDLMLAHVPKDQVERAYNRARHDKRRRELAQLWADMLLEGFRPAAELVELRRRA